MDMIKAFVPYYKPYRKVFFLDLFCAAVISIIDILYPQILRRLTGTLFTRDASVILSALPWLALLFLGAYILQTLCKYYVICQGHVMGAQMERDMRRELFGHYERLSFSYYDKVNTGQMMSKLISDLFDISELAHHGPENLFISLVKIVGSFVFLFLIQKKLALILFIVVIFMFLTAFAQRKKQRETFDDNRVKIGNINASLNDSLSGIRVVQAFGNEDVEQEKFNAGNEAFLASKHENYKAMARFHAGNTFFVGLIYSVTLVAGGYFIARGEMKPADLAMYALYIGVFVSPIQILVELTEMLQKGMAGFRRFREIMEILPEIEDAPDAVSLRNPEGDIVFSHVDFSYEKNETVLEDVSFTVKAGGSAAFVGPSGGGKTTICSLIPRFYDVTGGSVTIGGQDVRNVTLKSLRAAIGIVQQEVYLFDGTVRENNAYGKPEASSEEIVEAARKANIHEFIMGLPQQYETKVGERGTRLSGGQKQRISIARIFLKNPPILILDEATSALDNESEQYIQESLNRLSENRTTITIAHRLSTIRNAREIFVIEGNGITERGTHQELMDKNGTYARYYRLSAGEKEETANG